MLDIEQNTLIIHPVHFYFCLSFKLFEVLLISVPANHQAQVL